MTVIDFYASEGHFLEHLAPVWHALPPQIRGTFHLDPRLGHLASVLEVDRVDLSPPLRDRERPVVVSAWGDLRRAGRVRARMVLFEHGTGQSYSTRHTSYAGGPGRENVRLFLVPNEDVAAKNRRHYPTTKISVIGSPRLDALAGIPRARRDHPVVALGFHWRCQVAPEAGTALDHYVDHLGATARALEADGVEVLGHGHPRIWTELEPIYRAAGIEPVRWWPEVVARSDLYACDNSSTLFEFAALGRPVVVLNAPWFRRDVNHGLRFWRDAVVGLQVADPADLADVIGLALADPPALAEVRAEVVDRLYPVRDGSSARRAVDALAAMIGAPKICSVCGTPNHSCGPATTDVPVDDPVDRPRKGDPMLKRYANPAKPGAFLRLNEQDAKRLGLEGKEITAENPLPTPRHVDEVTNEGADFPPAPLEPDDVEAAGLVTSATAAARKAPAGAMPPAGPTHRARAKAARDEAPAPEPGQTPTPEEAPVPTPEDAPAEVPPEPKDKARPAPSPSAARRRRPAVTPSE